MLDKNKVLEKLVDDPENLKSVTLGDIRSFLRDVLEKNQCSVGEQWVIRDDDPGAERNGEAIIFDGSLSTIIIVPSKNSVDHGPVIIMDNALFTDFSNKDHLMVLYPDPSPVAQSKNYRKFYGLKLPINVPYVKWGYEFSNCCKTNEQIAEMIIRPWIAKKVLRWDYLKQYPRICRLK